MAICSPTTRRSRGPSTSLPPPARRSTTPNRCVRAKGGKRQTPMTPRPWCLLASPRHRRCRTHPGDGRGERTPERTHPRRRRRGRSTGARRTGRSESVRALRRFQLVMRRDRDHDGPVSTGNSTSTEIVYDEHGDVGVITIDRSEARNALTHTTSAELAHAVEHTRARVSSSPGVTRRSALATT